MTIWNDKSDFKNAVLDWASRLKIKVVSIHLRPMKNKWASCSTKGRLNFNIELLNMDRKVGEYVIIHELLHFRIPNHGLLWKSYMNIFLPDWEDIDKQLKTLR